MREFKIVRNLNCGSGDDVPTYLAVGMFDGVHLGHQAVIESAVHGAQLVKGVSGLLTFDPHPSRLFRPQDPTLLIQATDDKLRRVRGLGVDFAIVQTFDAAFASISADDFVPLIQKRIPKLRALCVGENFRFGKGREGDVDRLIASARKLGVRVVSAQRLRVDGEPISSTRIRDYLRAGEITAVNEMLGYCYEISSVVEAGKGLGRELGFPTLNLPWPCELQPRYGVYAVTVHNVNGGKVLPAVANFGVRPTVEQNAQLPLLEAHVLSSCDFVPGDQLQVRFQRFLRAEKTFDSIDALRAQIAKDIQLCGAC